MKVKCINDILDSIPSRDEYDLHVDMIESWLEENVGQRWIDWNWVWHDGVNREYHVKFMKPDINEKEILIFKLKFEVA